MQLLNTGKWFPVSNHHRVNVQTAEESLGDPSSPASVFKVTCVCETLAAVSALYSETVGSPWVS